MPVKHHDRLLFPFRAGRVGRKKELTAEELFRIIRRRGPGMIMIMAGALLLAVIFYFLKTPEYHAVSVVMIKDDKRSSDLLQAILGPEASVDINASKKDIALFKSMPIARQTIEQLERTQQGKSIELFGTRSYHSPLMAVLMHFKPFSVGEARMAEDDGVGREELLRQRCITLTKRIRVEPVKDTNMLNISVASPFPDEAELLTNTLCDVYRQADITRNSEKYSQANSYIAKSLVEQQHKVDEADRALSGFMTRNEIYEVSGNTQQLLDKLVDADAQYNAIQAEYHTVSNTLRFLEQRLSESDKAIGSQIEQTVNAKLGAIMEEIRGMEGGYVALLKQKGADDPAVKTAKTRLDEVKSRYETLQRSQIAGEIGYAGRTKKFGFDMIAEKLQIERKLNELQFRAGEFSRIRQYYEQKLAALPNKQQEFLKLERDRNVASKTYEELKQRFDETSIFLGSEVGGVSLIGKAFRPFFPESPSLLKSLLLGVLFGGMLAIGYAYIEEAMDGTLQDEGLYEEIGLKPLSVIPMVGPGRYPAIQATGASRRIGHMGGSLRRLLSDGSSTQPLEAQDGAVLPVPLITDSLTSSFAESIRILRTSIHYSRSGNPPQSILISGTAMWEGKSTVCLNLGMAYALVGKKTLIIDCDLRRPSQHVKLNCQRGPGLTDCLLGRDGDSYAPNIQSTGMDNLFLMSAGSKVSGSSELLASDEMQGLLALMKTRFDCILLDCPPFFLSDPAQLATWTDGVVLVSRLRYTERKMLRNIISDPVMKDSLLGVALIATPELSRDGYLGKYGSGIYEEDPLLLT
ncbi:lipopolysaccharide biosynthesis protein [Chlorobium sp. N1]|nr:lipopolysaccharide biosynthesis protein [Chlorobium sp. N1]